MGFKVLEREKVNDRMWDECLASSTFPLVYANSWYLDIVHPGWSGLIYGDYEAVFPITSSRKLGLKVLLQPLFAQQLGMFRKSSASVDADDFLDRLPAVIMPKLIRLNHHSRPESHGSRKRQNYIIKLEEIAKIEQAFNQNTKRNLKKALENCQVVEGAVALRDLHALKKRESQTALSEQQWQKMEKLMTELESRSLSKTYTVSEGGELISAVFFVFWRERIYYLFSASTARGKELRASFAIVYEVIKKWAGSNMTLDFEGSMDGNIARFFTGFGAVDEPYYEVRSLF